MPLPVVPDASQVTLSAPVSPPPQAQADPPQPAWPQTEPQEEWPRFPRPKMERPEPAPWDSWYAPARPAQSAADPDATRMDGFGLGPAPSGGTATSMLDDLGLAPPPARPQRPGRPPIPPIRLGQLGLLPLALLAAALVAVVVGAVVFLGNSSSPAAHGSVASPSPSVSSQAARRQAAVRLSGLLAQSGTKRTAVIDAVADVRGCGPSLPQDAQVLDSAASLRRRLLSRLGSLPGRSLLPAAMLKDLTGAWQASAQADTDLARWAADNSARGCHRKGRSDANLRASYLPDGQATADKRAFAELWNSVARQYGLATYQAYQL
jgi:hypothetical protein